MVGEEVIRAVKPSIETSENRIFEFPRLWLLTAGVCGYEDQRNL